MCNHENGNKMIAGSHVCVAVSIMARMLHVKRKVTEIPIN